MSAFEVTSLHRTENAVINVDNLTYNDAN